MHISSVPGVPLVIDVFNLKRNVTLLALDSLVQALNTIKLIASIVPYHLQICNYNASIVP